MRNFVLAGLVLCALPLAAPPGGGQTPPPPGTDPWFAKTTRTQFQVVKLSDAGFQVEWPKKDWLLLPSAGPFALVLATKKGDAMVAVERTSLRQPLQPSDITDLFAQLESDTIKEREKPVDLQARVIEAGDRRLAAVQYQRSGPQGTERVRQYSVPAGKRLYRLICVSSASQFLTYDPVFAHMAATFAPLPE